MKTYCFLAITGLVLLVGCANQSQETSSDSSTTNTTQVKETETAVDTQTIFTGVIQNEEQITDADGNALVFLEQVEAVTDPNEIVPNFETDGVGINVTSKQAGDWSKWSKGTKVQVTLEGLPVTTMSLPPQIPGKSIENVELLP